MGNSVAPAGVSTRVFACSDLHVDHASNWAHLEKVVREGGYTGRDVLIVAGDVSTELKLLRRTLALLAEVFHGGAEEDHEKKDKKKKLSNVFFCPGNNELRLSRSDSKRGTNDSLAKLADVLHVCDEVGVRTQPAKINDQVWVVPLLAWYSPAFDPEWDQRSFDYRRRWLDFRACAWPDGLDDEVGGVAAHFLAQNERWMAGLRLPLDDGPVVSFSHFLPRFELLPRRIFLHNKTLPLVVGDARLDQQIRRLGAQVHVFGHTHIDKDMTIDGVRYVQNAFGHPAERNKPWHALKGAYRPKLVLGGLLAQDGERSEEDLEDDDEEEDEEEGVDEEAEATNSRQEEEEEKEEEEEEEPPATKKNRKKRKKREDERPRA